MKGAAPPRILVLGYGNPARRDDGLGPEIAEGLEASGLGGVTAIAAYQLAPEDAASAAEHDRVIFVDASEAGPEPYSLRRIEPAETVSFMSHALLPETVLALCRQTFERLPEALLLAVRGYTFDLGEGLTGRAAENREAARGLIELLIEEWRGKSMAMGETGKTILIIDDDPDIRAATRIVLESAGFIVGEAATGEEGLKTAQRIKPDAVLLDLMMESVDAGSKVSTKLKEAGFSAPIFLLSSVGDAVRYNLDPRELGLAGIFQKPIDHKVLLSTLRTHLKIKQGGP